MPYPQTQEVFGDLQPGERVEVTQEVKVGFRTWESQTVGTVVAKERRRHGLHFNRNYDDKVYSDILVLCRDDGEVTSMTLDEYSKIKRIPADTSGDR